MGVDERTGLRMTVLVAVVAVVSLVLVFWLLRDRPPSYGCGDVPAENLDERVDRYRSGAIALHLGLALALGAVAALLSAVRCRRAGAGRAIGLPTAIGLGLLALFVAASLVDRDTFLILGLPAFLLFIPALAVVAVVGALAYLGRRLAAATTAVWVMLLVGLPGHLVLVFEQGTGPWLC